MQPTQKEKSLLKDMKNEEKLCVEKYTKYASLAKDEQLKTLFTNIAEEEQKHYDLLESMEKGTVPAPLPQTKSMPTFQKTYSRDSQDKRNDAYLCADLLSTEKRVSHAYDVCLFEFCGENAREVLDSIQTHEHGHGKAIYDYMSQNGMYQ